MVRLRATYCAVILLLLSSGAAAQDIRVTARADSARILIGDWLTVHLEAEHRSDATVTWPSFRDSLPGFEVVRRTDPVVRRDNDRVLESSTLILTAFDAGELVIPPIQFQYTVQGDTAERSAETLPIPVTVRGVAVDTSKDIRDIKPPMALSITLGELLPYIIGLAALGAVVWLVYYIMKKRKAGESIFPEEPLRPANEIALEALRALEGERLWQRGKVKEYHSEITDILRRYIERRFGILAMESTTDEILISGPVGGLPGGARETLTTVLVRADLVKFAKFQPAPAENEASLPLAVSFVESTVETTPAEQASEVTIP